MNEDQGYQSFILDPKERLVTKSKQDALDQSPSSPISQQNIVITAERVWEMENPQGFVEQLDPDHLVLWNFGIGSTQLKTEHLKGLNLLISRWPIITLDKAARIQLDGHASSSGASGENITLSRDRAMSAYNYLVKHNIKEEKIEIDYHGSTVPWSPNLNGWAMARNRRIEVRVIKPTAPLPPVIPAIEPPASEFSSETIWQRTSINKPGDVVPSFSFKKKFSFKRPPMPIGNILIIYPEAEFSVELELKTLYPATFEYSLKDGKWDQALKIKLDRLLAIKADTKGKLTLSFHNTFLKPEIEGDIWKPHQPISINASSPIITLPEFEIANGIKVKLTVSLKIKIGVGPHPALLVRIGASIGMGAAIAASTVVITTALTYAVASIVEGARERGTNRAIQIANRDGYAWRVADEVTERNRNSEARAKIEEYRRLPLEVFIKAYEGWMFADSVFNKMHIDERIKVRTALKNRFGNEFYTIQRNIFYALGGIEYNEKFVLPSPELLIK